MNVLYGIEKQVAGFINVDHIATKHGDILQIVGEELHHEQAGHVGFLTNGEVLSYYGERQASVDVNWNMK